jgi:hypothetical protein
MDKSIDLGKLQAEHRVTLINHSKAKSVAAASWDNVERARVIAERNEEKYKRAGEAVDKARKAVLEAARTVAQG